MNAPFQPTERGGSKASSTAQQADTAKFRPNSGLVAAGSLAGAIAASACCVLPLVLFGLGIGGAWIANLTALAPYKPFFVILTLGLIGYGYYLRRRSAQRACESCATPSASKLTALVFWIAVFLLALAVVFPYAAPVLLDV
jgi:mercuric ion transport protein